MAIATTGGGAKPAPQAPTFNPGRSKAGTGGFAQQPKPTAVKPSAPIGQKGPTTLQKPTLQAPSSSKGGGMAVQSPGPNNLPGAKMPAAGKPSFNAGSARAGEARSMSLPTKPTAPKPMAPKAPAIGSFNVGSARAGESRSMGQMSPAATTPAAPASNLNQRQFSPAQNAGMNGGM